MRQRSFPLEPIGFYGKMPAAPFSLLYRYNHSIGLLVALLGVSQDATRAGFVRQALELIKQVG